MTMLDRKRGPALAALAALALACGDPTGGPVEPLAPTEHAAEVKSATADPVECPTNETLSASDLIGTLGGTVSLDGHSIVIPAGALTAPTLITLTVPASNLMEIEIHANDLDSLLFEVPVEITISYSRCTRSNLDNATLTAWYIDTETNELLENMGGVDDKVARTVTFESGHLSGWVIAN